VGAVTIQEKKPLRPDGEMPCIPLEMHNLLYCQLIVRIACFGYSYRCAWIGTGLLILGSHIELALYDVEGRAHLPIGRNSLNNGVRLAIFGDPEVVASLPLSNNQLVLPDDVTEACFVHILDIGGCDTFFV
jgi:hypothetical protein